ncbi:SusC/RagA family TonB-linked outer membrane protein [Marinoscillum pacificum]|uniref:SusC/RagA family TonB-linked outer membrane protein n=1 Tax=Marinoscillum pacificum TaxID=392723 RepID=UPI002156FA6B|nr:SusC/RagA family TonB-linked outer membrane protein [Marinoscillum pacificum]
MKKHIPIMMMTFLLLVIIPYQLRAQVKVSGTVRDINNEPVIGATIVVEGTSNGTTTDIDGRYALSVPEDATLVYSFVGFVTKREVVNNRTTIDVSLELDLEELDEVVVTALGFKEDRDNLGYANSVVDNEAVKKAAESTLINSLSGKSSGVQISRNSGDPGAGAYIQIRGMSTITRDAQPLIVVDGVPISNDVRGNGAGRIAQQSRLNDINPNDIESVTILKGASAAALWGTQALGGVIMITTKSGKYNQEMKVTIKSSYSIDQINRKYPLQSSFGQGNNGIYNSRARDSWGDKISERAGGADEFNTSGEYFVDQDNNIWYPVIAKNSQQVYDDSNFDQVFQNGHFLENNISLSAGNMNSTAFFSISDLDQQGIMRNNSDYRRTTVRFNGEHMMNEKFRVNANTTFTRSESNRIRRGASSSGFYLGLLRNAPDFDISGYRGDYYSDPNAAPVSNRHRSYREPLGADATPTYNNPLWTINEQENLAKVNRFINTLKFTYSPTSKIDLIARFGLDHYSEQREEFITPGSAAGEFRNGLFSSELASNTVFNMDYIAKASRDITSKLNISGLVGFNFNQRSLKVDGSEISGFIQFTDVASPTRDIDNALPENRLVQSTYGIERTVGIYSSVTLSAYDQLFLTGTIRSETASTFGDQADNTFLFPSTSLAWQFQDLLDFEPISFGKLRISYGEVGVQPARYNTTNNFVSPTYSDQYGGGLSLGLYGNGGFVPSTSRGNPALRPERKKEFEVGTDLRFFKDKVSLSGTFFQNTTEDVLMDFPIANSRGYNSIYSNAAAIQNKGIEADLGVQLINTNDIQWNANVIYTRIRNEVTDLAGVESLFMGGLDAVNSRAVEGEPLGVLWGSRTLRDENGDIVYDENGFPVQDELEGVIGNPNPDWQGSFSTSISYKGITLSALFETFQGADIYAGTKSVLYDLGRWKDSETQTTATQNLLDYNGNVIPMGTTFRGVVHDFGSGPVALTEPWYLGDGGFFGNGNDELYVEDGSWTRLRELVLSYNLSTTWMQNVGVSSIELSATGRNLILWTEFEGNDPDTNLNGVSAARGIDYFNNPGTKSYVFTIILNL